MNKTSTRYKNRLTLALAVLLSITLAAAVNAQTKPPAMMGVTMVTVKPDMGPEFSKFIKDEYRPALVKGGQKEMWVWQSAGFGSAFQYVFVAPIAKMAELDGPSPIEKGLGAENMSAFFKKAGSMVTGVHSYAMAARQDLSYMSPSAGGSHKMAVIVTMKAAPGRQSEFENYMLNDFMPVFKKSDAHGLMMHQTVFGGNPLEYVMVVPIDNFADLDKGHPIARVAGMEGWKKIRDKMPGSVSDVSIMRLNTNMSIMAEPPK